MKNIILILSLLAMLVTSCHNKKLSGDDIIEFKDPLFLKTLLYDSKEIIDRNADGKISVNEASMVTELDVSNKMIKNLYEIKYFISLRILICSDNELTELDVSKNIALTKLDCSYNQLTAINVNKNAALKYLDCNHNQLTTLDLSKNTELEYLDCFVNQLTSLDVSKNTSLERLLCALNQLTSLDVRKNPALESLSCGGNQLTSLDLSKNIALKYLECGDNQLTSLDVSKNKKLTKLYLTSYLNNSTTITKLILYKHQTINNLEKEIKCCPNLSITYVE
ncbi:MAG: leucine-rich repeat domain-containing protein [Bacteroidales bacterium]|nr:leucine-rich repeat domain-containing protein [Bacteroidales bacterium]